MYCSSGYFVETVVVVAAVVVVAVEVGAVALSKGRWDALNCNRLHKISYHTAFACESSGHLSLHHHQ